MISFRIFPFGRDNADGEVDAHYYVRSAYLREAVI